MVLVKKPVIRGLNCPVARALELIGDRWTLLILRDLFLDGPRRYQDLIESLQGISPNLLSDRLKKLTQYELIDKELYSEHPPRYVYALTKKGESLRPVLEGLRDWGHKHTKLG
jgi:DNA-binding HxlR family transcriptional regulator